MTPTALDGPSGLATGALWDLRDEWAPALGAAALFSTAAVELTAGGDPRLAKLERYLDAHPDALDRFGYVSVHGPGSFPDESWKVIVERMTALPEKVQTIVLHGDCVDESNASVLRALGSRVAFENMDANKDRCQSADDMERVFERLPDARFVFDIAHSHHLDPTGALTAELAQRFAGRLAHLHCSVLAANCEHWPPREPDIDWMLDALAACPPVPRVWEQVPIFGA